MSHIISEQSKLAAYDAYLPTEHLEMGTVTDKGMAIDTEKMKETMYGSVEELEEEVKKFRNFPGTLALFRGELTDLIPPEPPVYKSLRNNLYIFKQDMIRALYTKILFCKTMLPEILPIVSFILRTNAISLGETCELMPFEEKKFNEFHKTLQEELKKYSESKNPVKLLKTKVDEIFVVFKKLLPHNPDDMDCASVLQFLKDVDKRKPIRNNSKLYENLIDQTALILFLLEKLFKENPMWLVPKSPYGPALVRLFIDDKKKFVLAQELFLVAHRVQFNTDGYKEKFSKMSDMTIIPFGEVAALIGQEQAGEFEFVLTPVLRTKYRALFIPLTTGGFCIPADELLLFFMHDVIAVKRLFQNATLEEAKVVWQLINSLKENILRDLGDAHFIPMNAVNSLKSTYAVALKDNVPRLMSNEKLDVLPVGPNGFTVADVENEFHRLRLTTAFPDFKKMVSSAFAVLRTNKKEDVLRTCDMHNIVEHSQGLCALVDYPELIQFFHKYSACSRLAMICMQCCKEMGGRCQMVEVEENTAALSLEDDSAKK